MNEPVDPHPVHAIESEQALLGAVLFDNGALFNADDLRSEHFVEPFHQRLWQAMEAIVTKGALAEPLGLNARFAESDEAYVALGGLRYLADLVDRAPPPYTANTHAATIRDAFIRRELVAACEDVICEARAGALPAVDVLTAAEGAIFKLGESGGTTAGFAPFSTALSAAVESLNAAMKRDGSLSGLSTGLIDLDHQLGGLHPSDLVILAGRPSMGKAQPLTSKVLMRDGTWRAMGDLRFGDQLASTDGAPSTVSGVFPQGEREVFQLTFSDGRSTRACAEHLWSIESCKLKGPKVVSTACLKQMLTKERFQRRVSIPVVSGHFGADRELPVDPWLLGVMIGNGSLGSGMVSFSTADAATLYRVQKVVGGDHVSPTGESGYDYRIRNSETGLKDALTSLGVFGELSHEKHIPSEYLAASREQRLELLRGLLDTDGWVEKTGAVVFSTTSERLAADVIALVRSLGGVCSMTSRAPTYTHNGEKREGRQSYSLFIRHKERSTLMSLTRKRRRCVDSARFRAPTIVSIELDGVEPVQCIAVTHPSHLYVTDDYVVTHNTALATNIAYNVARAGSRVGFFSLEMSAEQLANRLLAEVSGVGSERLRRGEVAQAEYYQVRDAAQEIATLPLFIDQTGAISIAKLGARARRLKRTSGLDLLVVDYLQLATAPDLRGQGRVQEVTAITMALKALAKELNIPVLALSQLSRQVEQRDDKRPQLSDLRESGSIEQDADVVMFVYREEYYLGRAEPKPGSPEHLAWEEDLDRARGQAECIVGKQRHGPIGTVKLAFNAELTRFGNLARDERYAGQRVRYSAMEDA